VRSRILLIFNLLVCRKILLITSIRLISLKRKRLLRKLKICRQPKPVFSTLLMLKSKIKHSISLLTTATSYSNNLRFSKL
jgi:hypothetical protein